MRPFSTIVLSTALLIVPVAASAQVPPEHVHAPGSHGGLRLGTVTFPHSGARQANAPFLRGLALLHSFEYEDAADAFRKAQRADPRFAMAFWGGALTHARLLWGLDGADSARAVLARLGATPEARLKRAKTPREQMYGTAVEALFQTGDLKMRIRGYVAALRALTDAHPNDIEARALLAIALQMGGAAYTDTERVARRHEAITLSQSIFSAKPDHPGGAHYLIHAADHPDFASRGLSAARAYAKIAPDADHALHMPSHIFLQLGAWDDVVASNERAWAASRAWVKARGVSGTELSFHSLWWLQYGYLQQGRYAAARALIDTVRLVTQGLDWKTSEAIDARYAVDEFQFTYARETGDWRVYGQRVSERALPPAGSPTGRGRSYAFLDMYRGAFASSMLGDTTTANVLAASFTGTTPMSHIARAHAAALGAKARSDTAQYIARLAEAAEADAGIVHSGPPNLYPAHELLGNALIEAGRPKDAIAAYEMSLTLMPNRSATLLGLARAQLASGLADEAARTHARVRANWHRADAGVLKALGH